jgi:hypothetical protein
VLLGAFVVLNFFPAKDPFDVMCQCGLLKYHDHTKNKKQNKNKNKNKKGLVSFSLIKRTRQNQNQNQSVQKEA